MADCWWGDLDTNFILEQVHLRISVLFHRHTACLISGMDALWLRDSGRASPISANEIRVGVGAKKIPPKRVTGRISTIESFLLHLGA